jgi:hypothetical protein
MCQLGSGGHRAIAVASSKLVTAGLAGLPSLVLPGCAGDNGSGAEIMSSKQIANLDADGFKALCDARDGTVEVIARCGGLASARGFSYDTGTQALSEHTCKGANTCAGWNCVTNE